MNIIKLKVQNFEIIPLEKQYVVENQVNEFAIEFEFDDTWDYESKYVVFDNEETTYKRPIINNQVIIPSELLNGRTTIQIYGQNVENGEIVKRKPSYKYSFSILNSLSTEGQEESDLPKPTQWELYISQIETMLDEFTTDYNEFKDDITEQFNDLKEDCESKCDDVIERLAQDEQDIQTNTDNIRTNAEAIDALNTSLLDYSLITETGNKISMSINPNTYVITLSLKDKNDNVLSTQSVDLPLETMIVSASYSNGVLTFALKNGQTLQVPIGDLISGLVSTDTFNEAVQGLSNRITTIENDYLKSTDKTELQEQITANADDISDIKGEQLTQNADIESLQQENERLQRIVSGLPTKNASGTNFVLNDMVNCEIKEISLKGDTLQDGTPTPDTPVEIQSVKGNQKIKVFGKNLLNSASIDQKTSSGIKCTYNEETQEITFDGTCTADNTTFNFIDEIVEAIENLTTSSVHYVSGSITGYCNFRAYNNDYVGSSFSINDLSNNNKIKYMTSNSTDTLSRISFRFNTGAIANNLKVKVMIANSTDTTYENYKTPQIKTISLGNIELCKIGDYQDKIYKSNDKWYLEKNIGKVVLNGSEDNFVYGAILENTIRIRYNTEQKAKANQQLCNRLIYKTMYDTDEEGFYVSVNSNDLYIRLNKSLVGETKETISAYMQQNNTIVYYAYATPVITEITDATLISQLEALNNYILLTNNTIISNGNLPVINDITGYVDIMSLLSTQDNRNVVEEKKSKPIEKSIEEPIENGEER